MENFGILPDEIVIEVFRFLRPSEILLNATLSCKRIHKLLESEFMYQYHHSKYLIDSFFVKSERLSWKEFTIKNFNLSRFRWVLSEEAKRRVVLKYGEKVVIVPGSNDERWGNGWAMSVFSNMRFDPEESYELELRIVSKVTDPCNCWLFFEDEDIGDFNRKYLFQVDSRKFFFRGNSSNLETYYDPETIERQEFRYLLDSDLGINFKVRIANWKIEVEVNNRGNLEKSFCHIKKEEMTENGSFLFGFVEMTMNFVKEIRLISLTKM